MGQGPLKEGGPKVQTFGYKINTRDVMYNMIYIIMYNDNI